MEQAVAACSVTEQKVVVMNRWRTRANPVPPVGPPWSALTISARLYVGAVIVLGTAGLVACAPRMYSSPALFAMLIAFACVTSSWKVNLPIPVVNGSTLSVSYAVSLASLLLLGPSHAVVVALAGVLMQCTYRPKQPYPLYRTLFSTAAIVITMIATGWVYGSLGGTVGRFDVLQLPKPLVGAIATYFLFNTGLIAGAIALSTQRGIIETWKRDFLWLGASFLAAGTAGALAAVVLERGYTWQAVLLAAPIYLIYRTYGVFVGRLEDQKRHTAEIRELHERTVAALEQARDAERALALEKERLTTTLEDMKRLEQAQRDLLKREHAARASAEQANRLKDQFLATVSHELRTPLTAILGWADMQRRGIIDERLRDGAAAAIYESAQRQAKLIEDLLDVARIASGKMRLERSLVALQGVINDAVQVIQPAADANEVRVRVDTDPSVGPVYGDAARLQQIAWNLLSNAVKFTPPGGEVRVRLRRGPDGAAEIVVSDTGQGIPPHFLASVFDPFRQADPSTTRVHHGLGIGLSIVKNLVEAHGGIITAHSEGHGQGSTFIVRLPVAAGEYVSEFPPHERIRRIERSEIRSLDGISVLVVDDDLESREIVSAYLRASHAGVLTASSAAQALDVLARQHVDVLLADIGMPEEDSYSLIRKVRRLNTAQKALVPAAALTAFARDEDRREALQAGFQMHLAKPIDANALIAAVARLGQMHGPETDQRATA
jgi:signal transduction histidine kinase/ActR/RegA family two-component response regulator